jgi:heme oxygenase
MNLSSRRFLVRDRTSLSHARVEAIVGSFATIADYHRYLRGTYVFRSAYEDAMAGFDWPADLPPLDHAPQLLPLLRQDLGDLGLQPPAMHESPLQVSDRETLLGALYVTEGSSLGARILYRRAQGLGLTGEFGARHLFAQSESLTRWRQLVKLLDEAPELDLDRLVAASETVFAAVGGAFERLQDA